MTRKREEPNETTEMWRDVRRAQQDRRAARLPGRTEDILALAPLGYRVRELTAYQFRVNNRLDLYPVHRRYHDLKTDRRGTYPTPVVIARRLLGDPGAA